MKCWMSLFQLALEFFHTLLFVWFLVLCYYASPSSAEAYRDWQLTTNFELWVEIFCVPTCFHMRIPKACLSVRLSVPREKTPGFVDISPTLVIDTSMERCSQVLQHWNPKSWIFYSKKVWNWILTCAEELKSPLLRRYQSYISNW